MEVKRLVLVDVQHLFYGIKRFTGDQTARLDYGKLFKLVTDDRPNNTLVMAYVITPSQTKDQPQPPMNPGSSGFYTGYIDDRFVNMLSHTGYRIRRSIGHPQIDDNGGIQFERGGSIRNMMWDFIGHPGIEELWIVSGYGQVMKLVEKAKEGRVKTTIISFPSDIHSVLQEAADKIIHLDGDYKFVPRFMRERGNQEQPRNEDLRFKDDGRIPIIAPSPVDEVDIAFGRRRR